MALSRLDKLLVDHGIAASRTQAQKLISAGVVSAKLHGMWTLVDKPSAKLSSAVELRAEPIEELKYVSRAGLKLEKALHHLYRQGHMSTASETTWQGQTVLDVGQSTGGFTDCALRHGASKVVGIDVGHDQLSNALREDPRVVCLEGINARNLHADLISQHIAGRLFDIVVMDVSFISQTLILPSVIPLLAAEGHLLSLVKPQFEVGKDGVSKGGLVKDTAVFPKVQDRICEALVELGLRVIDHFPSDVVGADGNQEFFVYAVKR